MQHDPVTVFGSTGVIGGHVVDDLIAAGHQVTAYLRNPGKVPDRWHGTVRLVQGEIDDPAGIEEAVKDARAVVSALGPSTSKTVPTAPLVTGARLIAEAMQRHGVRRYVALATPSVPDERDRRTMQLRILEGGARRTLPHAYEAIRAMSFPFMQSDLDWTLVRIISPSDGPRTSGLTGTFFGRRKVAWRSSRADIAAFMAAQVHATDHLRQSPVVTP